MLARSSPVSIVELRGCLRRRRMSLGCDTIITSSRSYTREESDAAALVAVPPVIAAVGLPALMPLAGVRAWSCAPVAMATHNTVAAFLIVIASFLP